MDITDSTLPAVKRCWLADAVFLTLLAVFLACLHHAARSDRPLFAAPVNPTYDQLQSLTVTEIRSQLGQPGVFLVDARTEESFGAGTIPTSLSLPLHSNLTGELLERLSHGNTVIVFCSNAKCGASKELAVMLLNRGLTNVKIFPGGFEEWRKLGYPVATGDVRG